MIHDVSGNVEGPQNTQKSRMQCNIIERAFEIARSGIVGGPDEIAKILVREGYFEVHQQIGGITIRKQLREACRAAKSPSTNISQDLRPTIPAAEIPDAHQMSGAAWNKAKP